MINLNPDLAAESGKKLINIRDASARYATAFWLEDGANLTIIHPDGTKSTNKCSYVDPYHFYFGHNCFHIDQFAELVQRNNYRCEPESYVTDLSLFNKFYADRNLRDPNGKLIPYRSIISGPHYARQNHPGSWTLAINADVALDRQVAFHSLKGRSESEIAFYSVERAISELMPQLELSQHETQLLLAVLREYEREVPRITEQEFEALVYKGEYADYDGKHPEWKGRRTAFLPGHGTTLFIEGVSFLIDSGKKPSLASHLESAWARCEGSQKPQQRTEPKKER